MKAIQLTIQKNAHLIPPHGDGMKLYVRPMLFGGVLPRESAVSHIAIRNLRENVASGVGKGVAADPGRTGLSNGGFCAFFIVQDSTTVLSLRAVRCEHGASLAINR
jgi:hypothetical protein